MGKGIRNHYRENMPLPERVLKDIRSGLKGVRNRLHHGGKPPILSVYPDFPSKKTTISKIADHLRLRLTNLPKEDAQVVLFFDDRTHKDKVDLPWAKSVTNLLNRDCLDISKEKVEAVHQEIFRYGTFIDPLTHQGTALMKSDENAKHDGQYIECPIEKRDSGVVYQRVLDNSIDDSTVVDLRVPIIGSSIPLVYKKFKSNAVRFTNDVSHASLHETSALLSEEEQNLILRFAKQMKADFCELDVIRDNGDGRIYIIDLNTTPYGPPAGLEISDTKKAVNLLANSFSNHFLS